MFIEFVIKTIWVVIKLIWSDKFSKVSIDLIIYSVPIHLRLPLNHGASLAWTGIVSIFRGATEDENGDDRDMYNE